MPSPSWPGDRVARPLDGMTLRFPPVPAAVNPHPVLYLAATGSSLQGAHDRVGVIVGPRVRGLRPIKEGRAWASDNDAYHDKFREAAFDVHLTRLLPYADRCLFVALPDYRHDPDSTLALWHAYAPTFAAQWPFPRAFVAQTGCTPSQIPGDADWLFLAGEDAWREGPAGRDLILHAHEELGIPTHVGRVNSARRLMRFSHTPGVRSADGTYLAFQGVERGLADIAGWLDLAETHRIPPLLRALHDLQEAV